MQAGGGGGQSSWSLPLAGVLLSDLQQPKSVSSQGSTGQPSFLGPTAGETPSGQQPNLDSLQVLGVGQAVEKKILNQFNLWTALKAFDLTSCNIPSSKGPAAGVMLSGQQPNLDFLHFDLLGLHRGLLVVE